MYDETELALNMANGDGLNCIWFKKYAQLLNRFFATVLFQVS
jgi:hypothetical protein